MSTSNGRAAPALPSDYPFTQPPDESWHAGPTRDGQFESLYLLPGGVWGWHYTWDAADGRVLDRDARLLTDAEALSWFGRNRIKAPPRLTEPRAEDRGPAGDVVPPPDGHDDGKPVGSGYVARRLHCTPRTVANKARRGDIPRSCVLREGGREGTKKTPWLFRRDRIDRWLHERGGRA